MIVGNSPPLGPNRTESEKEARIKIIDEYLEYQCYKLRRYYEHFPKKITAGSNYTAVIVEPISDYKSLEAVCRNVMYFLPSYWNLVVYSYDEELVKSRLTNMEYIFYKIEKPSLNAHEYSRLLMSAEFWNSIPGDNIIIFQTDSYITRRFTEDYISQLTKHSFIGALYTMNRVDYPAGYNVCSVDGHKKFSMSGGFSFRNKKAMLDCINNITFNHIIQFRKAHNLLLDLSNLFYEDFYFEHALYMIGYGLPNDKTCLEFCCQVQYDLINTHSFHGIYRDYVYEYLIYMLTPSLLDMHEEIQLKIKDKNENENENVMRVKCLD